MLRRLSILHDSFDASSAGLCDRSERLDCNVEQTTGNVSRTRVVVQHCAELRGVIFVPIDHSINSAARFRVLGAVCEQMLSPTELGNFSYQYGPAGTYQPVCCAS